MALGPSSDDVLIMEVLFDIRGHTERILDILEEDDEEKEEEDGEEDA
jgi:hypothetical protein